MFNSKTYGKRNWCNWGGGCQGGKGGEGGDLALTFPGQCTLTCLTTFHDTKLIFLLLVLTGR